MRFLWGNLVLLAASETVVTALPPLIYGTTTSLTSTAATVASSARRRGSSASIASSPLLRGGESSPSTTSATTTSTAIENDFDVLVSSGLRNLGNTCYMNAQLECAFHIPAVRSIVLSPSREPIRNENDDDNDESGDNNETGENDTGLGSDIDGSSDERREEGDAVSPPATPAALALKELFEGMVAASSKSAAAEATLGTSFGMTKIVYTPRPFVMKLGIPPMVQQDSQEFWKLLLPAIGSEQLTDLYKGIHEDYIVALDGSGHERRTDELFLDLSVDVAGSSSLEESLKSTFGKPELLSVKDGNGWRPVKGAEKVDAHKGSRLVVDALPPILQIHLKRFNYDWETERITKINQQLVFPLTLDLNSIERGNPDGDSENNTKHSSSIDLYDLQSVIVHAGEFDVGHYYAYVRPDVRNDRWYRFNDDIVEEVPFEDVQRDAFGGRVNRRQLLISSESSSSVDDENSKGTVVTIKKKGLFGKLRQSLLRKGRKRSPKNNKFGWGGETSNAYILQYVRRSDIPMLYSNHNN